MSFLACVPIVTSSNFLYTNSFFASSSQPSFEGCFSGTSEDEHDVHGVLYKRVVDRPAPSSHSLDLGLFVNGGHDKMALREVYSGSSTAYTVTKLQPFTSYAFRLQVSHCFREITFMQYLVLFDNCSLEVLSQLMLYCFPIR